MLDYPALAALSAILRTGSFEAAAAALGLTQSAVSQRLKGLEERIGTTLVIRGQPCTGTETGLRLARHAEDVSLLEHALSGEIAGTTPESPPRVRIAVNADSLATWFIAALPTETGLLYEIVIDDQDHAARLLREGRVAAAISADAQPVRGCDSVPLGALRYRATAEPGFARRWFPDGPRAEALETAPALVFDRKDRLQADWAARLAGRRIRLPAHFLPSSTGFVDAVLAGLGWGMNPEPLVAAHLAAGRLVDLAPDAPLDTPLHWQTRRVTRAAIAPLTASVLKTARRVLLQDAARPA